MKSFTILILLLFVFLFSFSQNDGTISGNQTTCYGAIPAKINLITLPSCYGVYIWQKSVNGGATFSGLTKFTIGSDNSCQDLEPLYTTTIYRIYTPRCGGHSNYITVNVLPQLLGGSISNNQTICWNSTPSMFTSLSSAIGGTDSFIYQWQYSIDNGASWLNIVNANTLSFTEPNNLTVNTTYRRVAYNATCGTVYSNTVTVTVNSLLTSGSIGLDQIICFNSIPTQISNLTFPTGGNGIYNYKWEKSVNSGSSWVSIVNSDYSYYDESSNLKTNTLYRRIVTSGSCGSATSNAINVTVYAALTGGAILGTQTIPYNTTASNLTNSDFPTGGNGSYSYSWKKSINSGSSWTEIIGANLNAYTDPSTLTVTTLYKRIASSGNCGSAESNTITVTVLPQLLGGSISGEQTVCFNSIPIQLANATSPSGGIGSFTYAWKKSVNGGSSWEDVPVIATDFYSCPALTQTTLFKRIATSGTSGSAESNTITVTVLPQLTSGAILANQTINYNTAPAPFTNDVSPTGGTGTYTFLWKKSINNGAVWSDINDSNTNFYTSENLTITTLFKRVVTSGSCGSVESNTITITVFSPLTGGSIAADQNICSSTIPAAFSNVAFPSGGNGSYVYTWKKSTDNGSIWTDINSANNATFAESLNLTNSTLYKRVATSGTCGSAESNSSRITVLPAFVPGTIGTAQQTICNGANPLTLSGSAPTGADGVYSFQWQSSPDNTNWANLFGETEAVYQPQALTASTYYKRIALNAYCNNSVSSNPIQVTVREKVLKPTVNVNGYYCKNSNVSLSISNPNSSSYKWYSSANVLLLEGSGISFPPLTADFTVSVISTLSNGCSSEPLVLSVNVDPVKAHFTYDVSTVTVGNAVRFSNSSINADYFRWNFFDGDLIHERTPAHYYNNCNGSYERKYDVSLLVRSSNSCLDSLIIFNAITVKPLASSVDDQVQNPVKVYPNPLTDNLTVSCEIPIKEVQVFNAIGLLIGDERYSSHSLVRVNFSHYVQGVYFVKVFSADGNVHLKKVIKQ